MKKNVVHGGVDHKFVYRGKRGLLAADEALGRFGGSGGSGAVGGLATGAAPRVVTVIPVAEAPTVAVVVWTIYAVELEVEIISL